AMLEDDLPSELQQLGFTSVKQELLAGQALQRITAMRPIQTQQP
ncbi:MAG: SAM-dependent methyltransferase, partial [Synechococcus sp. BS307-5m-G37]|nr:SAM-dependent methyltransferase [Synechococcus sp. BS307-5m-G37]